MRRYEIYSARKRRVVRLVDALLAPLGWLKSTHELAVPERLLLVRTAYLGDVVMALPALRAIRRRYPATHVTLLTSRAGEALLAPEGVADRILAFEPSWFYPGTTRVELREVRRRLRAGRFDMAVDLRGDLREIAFLLSGIAPTRVSYDFAGGGALLSHVVPGPGIAHKVDVMLGIAHYLGAEPAPPRFGLADRPEGRAEASRLLEAAGVRGPYVLAHTGTRVALKSYDRFEEAIARIATAAELPVAVIAEGARKPGAGTLLGGGLSVDGLVELVRGARALLCHDSAPWHVAQAVGTPACALFGPSKPALTGLYPGRPGVVLSQDLPCRDRCDESVCREGAVEKQCLVELSPDRVAAALLDLLAGCRQG